LDRPDGGCLCDSARAYNLSVMSIFARFSMAAVFALLLGAVPALAAAQTPAPTPSPSPAPPSDPCGSILSIVNRPTVGTGVCTVRTNHFDVENGYTNTVTTGAGGGETISYPQSLIRVGTGDPHLDFEVGAPTYERSSLAGTIAAGWSDVNLGAKYELGYSANADWGVNVFATLPTGSTAFTVGRAQYSANFNWAYTLNSEFGLSGTVGANDFTGYNANGALQSYYPLLGTLEISAALPGGPSQLSAEYAYFSAAGPGFGSKSIVDFIYQRDFGPHIQFDAEYGISPTVILGQKQHYLGAGLTFMN
jgi:hypothetical protein